MSTTKQIERPTGRRFARHSIVYTAAVDILCAVRAMQGRSTLAIAEELHLSMNQVTYRVLKAQKAMKTRFRADYRNGTSALSRHMLKASEQFGIETVRKTIAPKFIPFAASGVSRIPRSGGGGK